MKCGCFSGDIQQFEEAVRDTHGDSQYGKEYMAAIELAKVKIKLAETGGKSRDEE